MSLVIAPLGPISEFFYFKDYWRPETFSGLQFGVEDLIFSFTLGGISSVLYEELAGRVLVKRHFHPNRWAAFVFPVIVIATVLVATKYLQVNSIYASYAAFALVALIMLRLRPDLIREAILSAIFLTIITSAGYIIWLQFYPEVFNRWWFLSNLSGILVFGIPLEEISWYSAWGMVAGPLYEFGTGFGDRKRPSYNKRR